MSTKKMNAYEHGNSKQIQPVRMNAYEHGNSNQIQPVRGNGLVGFVHESFDHLIQHVRGNGLVGFAHESYDHQQPQENDADKKLEMYGPYGSQRMKSTSRIVLNSDEKIEEVEIGYDDVIQSIKFSVANTTNSVTGTPTFNPGKGSQIAKIKMRDDEKIERISGTYGKCSEHPHNDIVIATLKIHTNAKPDGYGPYGKGSSVSNANRFDSNSDTKGPIVGFFARHPNDFIESLGVFVRKE